MSDDPFDIFDAEPSVPAASAVGLGGKRPRPSPVLARIRHFALEHIPRTASDLRHRQQEQQQRSSSSSGNAIFNGTSIAGLLEDACDGLTANPPQLESSRVAATEAADAAWEAILLLRKGGASSAHASLVKEAYVEAQYLLCGVCAACDDVPGALSALDRAFILGGLTDVFRDCSELLDEDSDDDDRKRNVGHADADEAQWRRATAGVAESTLSRGTIGDCASLRSVERHPCPLTSEAFSALHRARKPLLFEGVATDWAATRKWSSLAWLKARFGARLVPVEIGRLHNGDAARCAPGNDEDGIEQQLPPQTQHIPARAPPSPSPPPQHQHQQATTTTTAMATTTAGSTEWGERIMTLGDFIDTYLIPPSVSGSGGGGSGEATSSSGLASGTSVSSAPPPARGAIGYLAQHALFEQLPKLRRDFGVPAPCGVGTLRHVNAWLGPEGTVTPLHFDSYDNILTNVLGYKRVRLYESSQTPHLYVTETGGGGVDAQGNVSAVDVEAVDLERFPEFAQAVGSEVILGPGEGLFIPAGCWHHVRSLSTCFSISFWFE